MLNYNNLQIVCKTFFLKEGFRILQFLNNSINFFSANDHLNIQVINANLIVTVAKYIMLINVSYLITKSICK